ncbi:hypothetical protein ACHAXS_001291 [Conticribra weissflogii]
MNAHHPQNLDFILGTTRRQATQTTYRTTTQQKPQWL